MTSRAPDIRIRVKAENADHARKLFVAAGFPESVEESAEDGCIVFAFTSVADERKWAVINSIPKDMYAISAVSAAGLDPANLAEELRRRFPTK
jgi:hypothetical protein